MSSRGNVPPCRPIHRILPAVLLAAGIALLANQSWIRGKAMLASVLIERAFAAHMEDGRIHTPWRWADIHPIARLSTADGKVTRTILSGASGSSLAFGPGHIDGTAAPNARGNCVIAGHRDTWFRFLKDLECGERMVLTSVGGSLTYSVSDLSIVDQTDTTVLEANDGIRLTLITCYPFEGMIGSRWRYVVVCEPI